MAVFVVMKVLPLQRANVSKDLFYYEIYFYFPFYLLFVFLFSSDFLSYITTRKSRLILAVRSHCLKGNMFADAPYFCGSAFAARAFGSTADLLSTFLRYPPPRYHSLMSVMLTVVPLFNLKR